MLAVHHLGISQSDRVVWICEELGVPYQLVRYARDPVTRLAPPEYKALHPAGTAPVIVDGNVVLGESAATLEYIARKHGGGRLFPGPDHPGFAEFLYWFHFANGSLMASGLVELAVMMAGGGNDGDTLGALLARSNAAYDMIEHRLGEAQWFAGDEFTAADIMMAFPLTTMRLFVPRDISGYPNLLAYLARLGSRETYRAAMAKADPDLPLNLS